MTRLLVSVLCLVAWSGHALSEEQFDCVKLYEYSDNSSELGNICHKAIKVIWCNRGGGNCGCNSGGCTKVLSGFQSRVKVSGDGASSNAGGKYGACDASDSPTITARGVGPCN